MKTTEGVEYDPRLAAYDRFSGVATPWADFLESVLGQMVRPGKRAFDKNWSIGKFWKNGSRLTPSTTFGNISCAFSLFTDRGDGPTWLCGYLRKPSCQAVR